MLAERWAETWVLRCPCQHQEHPRCHCGTSQSCCWSICIWLQSTSVPQQPLWRMCVRPVGPTGGSTQGGFLPGVPEGAEEHSRRAGSEPCKSVGINKPSAQEVSSPGLPLSVGLTKKCIYFLQLFLNSKLTGNSWKPPERSLWLVAPCCFQVANC